MKIDIDQNQQLVAQLARIGLPMQSVPTVAAFWQGQIADVFQGPNLGVINGLVVTSFGLGGSFSPWLAGWVFDHTGSYVPAFLFALSAVVVSAVLIWVCAC